MKLDGKVALVTGAAGGIGQAIARRLAHEGAHVALADIRTKPLDGITRTIESYDRKALTVAVDVTQSDQVTQMVQAVVEAFGRIDIFFNNAGIIRVQNFLDVTEAEWDHVIDVNLKGVFLCGQAVAKHMVERQSGKIINTASLAAHRGRPEIAAYAASGEGIGKAGGYAIQGRAAGLIDFLSGSHSGVVGLPLFETRALLRAAGIALG